MRTPSSVRLVSAIEVARTTLRSPDGAGPIGLTAGELPRAIRAELNRLVAGSA